jgi:hypothetical protein
MLCIAFLLTLISCAPIPVHKCVIDYRFDSCGKKIGEYQECVLVNYRTNPNAIKHPELLE